MFAKIKELFFGKPATVSTEAPYKVEAPTPVPEVKTEIKSDGGTWPFPVVETTVQPEKPVAKVTKAKKAPAKKPSAAKAAAKPRAKKSAK